MTNRIICQACGAQNSPEAIFCEDCGIGITPNSEQHRASATMSTASTAASSQAATVSSVMSIEGRKYLLSQRVALMATQGYRVESQSDFMAVLVSGRRVNHLLHFFIGIFTLGLWWIIWIMLAIFGGERRQVITVDEYGNLVVGRRTVG